MVYTFFQILLLDKNIWGADGRFPGFTPFSGGSVIPRAENREEKQTPVYHYNSLSGITIGNYKLAFQRRIRGYLD